MPTTDATKPAAVERATYTTAEAATILGVHHVTVKRWVADGRIPSFKVGAARRIRRDVLEAVMNPTATVLPRLGDWNSAEEFVALMRPER